MMSFYVPSVEELEALDVAKELQNKGFGGIPIEIGYCNGHNKKLNASGNITGIQKWTLLWTT